MLHEITDGSGVGFCGAVLPSLLPAGYHGPLVVALDSNILIDMQFRGPYLMGDDDELPESVARDEGYVADLDALAQLLDIWMLRDIRLVVTPRSRSDGRRLGDPTKVARRHVSIDAIADSLQYQTDRWGFDLSLTYSDRRGVPDGDLVAEAAEVGAHVFLTRDRGLIKRYKDTAPATLLLRPGALVAELREANAAVIGGGLCGREDCPYGVGQLPAPDMGKWTGLLSILSH